MVFTEKTLDRVWKSYRVSIKVKPWGFTGGWFTKSELRLSQSDRNNLPKGVKKNNPYISIPNGLYYRLYCTETQLTQSFRDIS